MQGLVGNDKDANLCTGGKGNLSRDAKSILNGGGKAKRSRCAIHRDRFAFPKGDSTGRMSRTMGSCTPLRELLS